MYQSPEITNTYTHTHRYTHTQRHTHTHTHTQRHTHTHTPVTANKQTQQVAGSRINTQKLFLYINNYNPKKEIKKTISFTIGPKRIKYLGRGKKINLHLETIKHCWKKLNTINRKTSYFHELENSILLKMATLLKVIHWFNPILYFSSESLSLPNMMVYIYLTSLFIACK